MGSRKKSGSDETWQLVLELHRRVAEHLGRACAELDLRPGQAEALQALEPGRALPMGEVARHLRCDPSTVTGIADQLERKGLVERRPAPEDRRVKALVLTTEGEARRNALMARLEDVPGELASLSPAQRRALRGILRETLGA